MMRIDDIKVFYFLGIGGIGMSALARYFNAMGKKVYGYDKTSTKLTAELIEEGISISFEDTIESIPQNISNAVSEKNNEGILIVYTPAVPKDMFLLKFFEENGFEIKKRSEVLGLITKSSFNIAIAGTHGKTTTSSIVAHLLTQSEIGCNAFLGGITQNYNSNLLLNTHSNYTVVEADEYDRSFLTLSPDVAVITSVDADHLDIYGDKNSVVESFALFSKRVKKDGKLLIKKGIDLPTEITENAYSYSVESKADFFATNIRIEGGLFVFDFVSEMAEIKNLSFAVPGRHNIENAVAAIAACLLSGLNPLSVKQSLASFKGVKRRFEYHIKNHILFIDDYAHHPEEIKACVKAVKELYPNLKVTGVFQPHLYSRTRDFVDGFAASLDLLDECILLDIYPARELPIKGVTSQIILDRMKLKNKSLLTKAQLIDYLFNNEIQVFLTMGAGDIDMLLPSIKEILEKKV